MPRAAAPAGPACATSVGPLPVGAGDCAQGSAAGETSRLTGGAGGGEREAVPAVTVVPTAAVLGAGWSGTNGYWSTLSLTFAFTGTRYSTTLPPMIRLPSFHCVGAACPELGAPGVEHDER